MLLLFLEIVLLDRLVSRSSECVEANLSIMYLFRIDLLLFFILADKSPELSIIFSSLLKYFRVVFSNLSLFGLTLFVWGLLAAEVDCLALPTDIFQDVFLGDMPSFLLV